MQLGYSLLFDEFGYRTTILYQLASGILAGKYNNVIPKKGSYGQNPEHQYILNRYVSPDTKNVTIKKLNQLSYLANELGWSLPQLALIRTIS